MPLHDWSNSRGWDNVHLLWIVSLLHWIQPRLPEGYRAFVGTAPRLSIGRPASKPDLSVRRFPSGQDPALRPEAATAIADDGGAPDFETTSAALEEDAAIFIEVDGWFVAAIELVSPRNKDRPDSRDASTGRYLGYLKDGVNLLLLDVLPRPAGFSFADRLAESLGVEQPATPAPFAVSYRVGEPTPDGGKFLAVWRRPMVVGEPLPTITLPLTVHRGVAIDLEQTYAKAAADAYLD